MQYNILSRTYEVKKESSHIFTGIHFFNVTHDIFLDCYDLKNNKVNTSQSLGLDVFPSCDPATTPTPHMG
jgi:hypothetical protein